MSAAAGLPPLPRARARRHLAVQPSEVDLFVSQGKSSGQDLEHAISFTNCTNTRQTRQPPECSESHECARLVPYGSTYSTQSAVHNPLCAWSLEWIHVAGTTWKAGRRGGTFEERGCAKSRLTTGSPPPPSPARGADVSDFTNHARHARVALVIGLPNGGPRSLLLVHLVRVRVRVRVRQPYQPKTVSPTLHAENPKADLS